MDKSSYTDINSRVIDGWGEGGWEWGMPISHETYLRAKNGSWNLLLTPTKFVPNEWYAPFSKNGRLGGARLLGLASGGGQQMPVFAALGADCTVLDYSDKQLEGERLVSEREGYGINIVKADMSKRLPFDDESFDLIFHPVSNIYVEDVYHVWNECFRILKRGGVLLAGLDNGYNFIVEDFTARPLIITGRLPYNPLKMPEAQFRKIAESSDGIQFSHNIEEQIGGQLKAGFILTDIFEDFQNDSDAVADGIPAYWATRAVKPQSPEAYRAGL